MLYGPEDPPTDLMIRKYLLDEMEGRTRTIENCRRVIAEQTEATRSDRDRLTKILARIHRLHTVGPDPQQEFELEEES